MDPFSFLLALILEAYALIYAHYTIQFMEAYNFRFKKDFNDMHAFYLFYYNCMNYFLPLIIIAIFKKSFLSIFTILFVFLVIENIEKSLMRWSRPRCCYSRQVNKMKKLWKDKFKSTYKKKVIIPQREKIICQIQFNNEMMSDEQHLAHNYMDLIMQFGYITLFSTVFPLAGLISWMCNGLTMSAHMLEIEL